jgi:hypothetical protein
MADASIKWERERDPLYTRLSERNNKRLSTFYSFLAGGYGETNADYCLSPSSAPLSERYFTRGDIRPAPHLNALRKKEYYIPENSSSTYIGEGWWQYIVAAVQLYYTSERLFIRNDERSRKKREKKARMIYAGDSPSSSRLRLPRRCFRVKPQKEEEKGATLCFRSSFDEKDSVCLWYA